MKKVSKIHSCRICGETDLNNFYKSESTYKGKTHTHYKLDCKPCLSKIRAEIWKNDKGFRDRKKKRANSDKYKKKASEYHFKNRDRRLRLHKEWYYNKGGNKRAKEYQKEYHKLPHVKAGKIQREIVGRIFRKIGTKKEKHSHEYLDYTAEDLRLHIESLFKPGMSWENHGMGHGRWQLDHIKEVDQFISEGIEDPNIINALSNLQPLWTEEHAKKSGKYLSEKSKKEKNVFRIFR